MELIFFNRMTFEIVDFGFVDKDYQLIIDSVIPQKSTFSVNKKNINAKVGDLLTIKDKKINYIGIICSLEEDEEKGITKVQSNDFISILDIKVKMNNYSGNLSYFLFQLINATYISNVDPYQRIKYLRISRDYANISGSLTFEKDTIDSISNLLNTLSKSYSIEIKYNLVYENGSIIGIELHITTCTRGLIIKSIFAGIKDLVISESNEQTINKVIFVPSDENITYKQNVTYYLLTDGTITTNALATNRIENIATTTKVFKDSDYPSLETTARSEMLISSLEHSIEFNLKVDNKVIIPFENLNVGDYVEFITPTKTYSTMVSRFTFKNNLYQVAVVLGEYRISLTDKIKLLTKK